MGSSGRKEARSLSGHVQTWLLPMRHDYRGRPVREAGTDAEFGVGERPRDSRGPGAAWMFLRSGEGGRGQPSGVMHRG